MSDSQQQIESNGNDTSPARVEYPRRLTARRAQVVRCVQQERRVSIARAVVFLGAVAVAWLALDRALMSAWWIALPVAAFAALVMVHDRVITERRRAERGVV